MQYRAKIGNQSLSVNQSQLLFSNSFIILSFILTHQFIVGPPSLMLQTISGYQYALEFLCHFVTMVTAHISHISWLTPKMTRGMAQKKQPYLQQSSLNPEVCEDMVTPSIQSYLQSYSPLCDLSNHVTSTADVRSVIRIQQ